MTLTDRPPQDLTDADDRTILDPRTSEVVGRLRTCAGTGAHVLLENGGNDRVPVERIHVRAGLAGPFLDEMTTVKVVHPGPAAT